MYKRMLICLCMCVFTFFCVCQGGGGLLHQDRFKTKNWIHSFSRQNEVKRKNTADVIHPIRFTSTNKKKLCFINLEVGRHYRSPPYIQLCLSIFGGETWGTAPIYGTFFKRTGHLGHTILALYPQREKKKKRKCPPLFRGTLGNLTATGDRESTLPTPRRRSKQCLGPLNQG